MHTRILKPGPKALAEAAAILRAGGLVGMPTETVYGLAGSAFDEKALAAIFAAKERPTFDPLIVHVAPPVDWPAEDAGARLAFLESTGLVDLAQLTSRARGRVAALAAAFWPGPLTLVLPKRPRVPDLATSGLPTVAVRMPAHPVARALILEAGVPVAAPSANRFGRISPTTAKDVVAELDGRIPVVLDGGACGVGVESTVASVSRGGAIAVLRPGGVSREALSTAAAAPVTAGPRTVPAGVRRSSPGTLESHYAPSIPLRLLGARGLAGASLPPGSDPVGLLLASGDARRAERHWSAKLSRRVVARSLSESGNAEEAARRLFSALRALDASGAVALFAEPWPDEKGLGHAIADRLRRAAG